MPTNRVRRGHAALLLGPIEIEHLELGPDGHLLAGDCWICERGMAAARSAWLANRAVILAAWRERNEYPTFAERHFGPDIE